ncbi:uncharacterized protein LOC135500709 [Lineus longissimus]|uniref:uncharacterized protein LOC135500709 n=1 Tax=Lineus longissimus TaxID=88925 RepID=UPI00315C73F0
MASQTPEQAEVKKTERRHGLKGGDGVHRHYAFSSSRSSKRRRRKTVERGDAGAGSCKRGRPSTLVMEDLVVVAIENGLGLRRFISFRDINCANVASLDGTSIVCPVSTIFGTIQLESATAGDIVMIISEAETLELQFAKCVRAQKDGIYVTFDNTGLEFFVPKLEFFEVPSALSCNEEIFDDVTVLSEDCVVQQGLHVFRCLLKKLSDDFIYLAGHYREACRSYSAAEQDHAKALLALKEKHLEDISTLNTAKEFWCTLFANTVADNNVLCSIVKKQADELVLKDAELLNCKNEILKLQNELRVKDVVLEETVKRLTIQIDVLKGTVTQLRTGDEKSKATLVSFESQVTGLQEDLAKTQSKLKLLQSRLKGDGQSILEVKESSRDVIQVRSLSSGKRCSQFARVPRPEVPASNAKPRSLSDRSKCLKNVLKMLCNNDEPSRSDMVTLLTHFVKNNKDIVLEACQNAKVSVVEKLSPGDSVDLKILLKLPMSRFRDLRLFLESHGVSVLANELLMRQEMKKRYDSDSLIEVGLVELFKTGGSEKPTPIAFCRVKSVLSTVKHYRFIFLEIYNTEFQRYGGLCHFQVCHTKGIIIEMHVIIFFVSVFLPEIAVLMVQFF